MSPAPPARAAPHGRYVIGDEIAAGGMATVHLGKMLGDAGFSRTVALKRLHPQFAKDLQFCAMLLDEGRLCSRLHHLNVVTTLDVVASGGELFMVMEYVHGEPLSALLRMSIRRGHKVPPRIVAAVVSGALRGLHAAHDARDARGEPLGIVHRDVSPQNIMVGTDGIARVLDFGIAKAAGRAQITEDGQIKGKFAYMPPEQLHGDVLDRRADVYAAGVVLWEALVAERLFQGDGGLPDLSRLLDPDVDPPSSRVPGLPPAFDAVTLRALAAEAADRWPTALAMAEALEACGPVAAPAEVGAWVEGTVGDSLLERAGRIAAIEKRLTERIRESQHFLDASDAPVASVAELTEAPPPVVARRPAALWGAAAIMGVAAAVSFAGLTGVRRASPGAPDAPPATAAPEASAAPSATAAPVAVASSAPADDRSALPVKAAPSGAPAVRAVSPAVVAAPRGPRVRSAADPCAPPFTVDEAGHKHYKRECLR
jgi:serine/threonine-protein kinase